MRSAQILYMLTQDETYILVSGFAQVNPKSVQKMLDVRLLFHALICMYV